MRVAYISHHGRPNYEYDWLAAMPVEQVLFVDTSFASYPSVPPAHVSYRTARFKENRPVNRLLHSTAAWVRYRNLEECIRGADIVLVLEAFSTLSRQAMQLAQARGIPCAVLVYELIFEHPLYSLPGYRGNARYCLRHADGFIAVTERAREHLMCLGAPGERVRVVYPGIDTGLFRPNPIGRRLQDLIFVGKLAPHKGIDVVIETARFLQTTCPESRLTVVGDGEGREAVEAAVRELPNIRYLGRLTNQLLPPVLARHGAYLLPARDTFKLGRRIGAEQFGFSVAEAMACGLAIVTSDCGALPEVAGLEAAVCPQKELSRFPVLVGAVLRDPRLEERGAASRVLAVQRYDQAGQSRALADALSAIISGAAPQRP